MHTQTDGDYTLRVVTPFGTTRLKKVPGLFSSEKQTFCLHLQTSINIPDKRQNTDGQMAKLKTFHKFFFLNKRHNKTRQVPQKCSTKAVCRISKSRSERDKTCTARRSYLALIALVNCPKKISKGVLYNIHKAGTDSLCDVPLGKST